MRHRYPFFGRPAAAGAAVLAALALAWPAPAAQANHTVLVEGNCLVDGPHTTMVPPGTCGDYDGDGRVGAAEDADGNDQIFGTLTAALAGANQGANQNGRVTIVTSGVFLESVHISAANGSVIVDAAPGVEAVIEAVRAGDAQNNTVRQGQPGIVIDAPDTVQVTLRHLVVRNWIDGIVVRGRSRVSLQRLRLENNRDHGVLVQDDARVSIRHTEVHATGFRMGAGVDNTPQPGYGIAFGGRSSGLVADSTLTGNFGAGLANETGRANAVEVMQVAAFDNNPNFRGVQPR